MGGVGGDEHQTILCHPLINQRLAIVGTAHKADLYVAVQHHLLDALAVAAADDAAAGGIGPGKPHDLSGQQTFCRRRGRTDDQLTLDGSHRGRFQRGAFGDHVLGVFIDPLAIGSQFDGTLGLPSEQRHPQGILQSADMAADGGLGQI